MGINGKHSMPHLIQKKEKKPITLDGDDEVRSISSTPATGTTPTGTPVSSARASPQPKEKEEKVEDEDVKEVPKEPKEAPKVMSLIRKKVQEFEGINGKHSMPHLIQKKEKKPITLDGDDEVRSISSTPATGTTPTG